MDTMIERLEAKYGFVMTKKEVMEVLKVSLATINRRMLSGKLTPMESEGSSIKFRTSDIAELIGG